MEKEAYSKRGSPRTLMGRSEKCRQMLDVPEVFSLLQCVILSHQVKKERENTTITGTNNKYSDRGYQ